MGHQMPGRGIKRGGASPVPVQTGQIHEAVKGGISEGVTQGARFVADPADQATHQTYLPIPPATSMTAPVM